MLMLHRYRPWSRLIPPACTVTCTEGLRRCYIPSTGSDKCCNYYLEGDCVESCTSGLVPNSTTYDCGEFESNKAT